MERTTLAKFGAIICLVVVIAILIAFATPFGKFVTDSVKTIVGSLDEKPTEIGKLPYVVEIKKNISAAGTIRFVDRPIEENKILVEGAPSLTVTATENSGYIFLGWYNEETLLSSNPSYTFTTTKKTSITAMYEPYSIPGLYDANGTLIVPWDTLVNTYGMNVAADYTIDTYKTNTASPYYVLTNTPAISSGARLIIDEVNKVGNYAFYDCDALASVKINDSVTAIGDFAFRYCSNLVDVEMANSITTIGHSAFFGCSKITNIAIPAETTRIGENAFDSCDKLLSIYIPAKVESIGRYAFSWCNSLEHIYVESGNPTYHSYGNCLIETATKTLIAGCNNSIIPADGSVITIKEHAFSSRRILKSIVIPEGITRIETHAFYECKSLKSIDIPASVTYIGARAFSNCNGLERITVNDGNSIFSDAENCIIETATKTVIAGCKNSIIPADTKIIGASAFYGCEGLRSITVPASVTTIGDRAFYHSGLDFINVEAGNSAYRSSDNCLIENSSNTLLVGTQYSIIPAGVTKIANYAFDGEWDLTTIEIPSGVTSIGTRAFWDCGKLTTITIPATVTNIGEAAFQHCVKLTNITFEGTSAQWSNITKGLDWDARVPATIVTCSNGTVPLN